MKPDPQVFRFRPCPKHTLAGRRTDVLYFEFRFLLRLRVGHFRFPPFSSCCKALSACMAAPSTPALEGYSPIERAVHLEKLFLLLSLTTWRGARSKAASFPLVRLDGRATSQAR